MSTMEKNTQWTLVASGMREWDGIYTPPWNGRGSKSL